MTERNILVTGGAGFIGSNLVRYLVKKYPDYRVVNYDALTYAGHLPNLEAVADEDNYLFVEGDVTDSLAVRDVLIGQRVDTVIHLAAESHVDRSIDDPLLFVRTNVLGTATLLQETKTYWGKELADKLFYHVSTDEVYGSLGAEGYFVESTAYDPRSPYSASKAGSDHLVRAWYHTYGLPVVLSNCSNNYGPYQHPEKLIPLFIHNILRQRPLPVYGLGVNIRDWLHVQDHVRAIDLILHKGKIGETYNIGGHNEWKNIDLVNLLCQQMDYKLGRPQGASENLITYVTDRAGHDLRYAIDAGKLYRNLGWIPEHTFETGLAATIDWYLANESWLKQIA